MNCNVCGSDACESGCEDPYNAIDEALLDAFSDLDSKINPSHYQEYCDNLQWIETMNRIPSFHNPDVFRGALELQVRKYLDRCGRKDERKQELFKALWYMKYLCAYVANDNKPIRVKDIDKILRKA
jgi:hypothetical protein